MFNSFKYVWLSKEGYKKVNKSDVFNFIVYNICIIYICIIISCLLLYIVDVVDIYV